MIAIYDRESTKFLRVLRRGQWVDAIFETEGAARAHVTRETRKGKDLSKFAMCDLETFRNHIEKKEIRHGLVHTEGKTFEVPVNTPWTSGPWSETYWCS
jgi:hypothetical protein